VIARVHALTGPLSITAVNAPDVFHCAPGGDNSVVLTWSTVGAQSVDIAVDKPSDLRFKGQAPESQVSVPGPCAPARRTYIVIARSPNGDTVTKTATTRGV
jgi:hypothetical protein